MPHRHDVEAAPDLQVLRMPHRCTAIIKKFGISSAPRLEMTLGYPEPVFVALARAFARGEKRSGATG
jgi:hypothetical protein